MKSNYDTVYEYAIEDTQSIILSQYLIKGVWWKHKLGKHRVILLESQDMHTLWGYFKS